VIVAASGRLGLIYAHDAADRARDAALMDRGGMANSPRPMAIRGIVLALLPLLLSLAAAPVTAQAREPAVTVDLSVLDQLGPPPTVADVLRSGIAPPRTAPPPRDASHRPAARKHPRVAKAAAHPEAAAQQHPVVPVAESPAPAPPGEAAAAQAKPEAPAAPADKAAEAQPAAPAPPADAAAETRPAAAPSATANGALDVPPAATPQIAAAPAAPTAVHVAAVPTATDLPPAPAAKPAPPPTVQPRGFAPSAVPSAPLPSQPKPSSQETATMGTAPSQPAPGPVAAVEPARPLPVPLPGTLTVLFPGKTTDLSDDAKAMLDKLVPKLASDEHARMQIVGFAGGPGDDANESRRISLQRTIVVRTYLAERGVANGRMDLRAHGNKDGATPPDRVDIMMIAH
jgi:outer membrane protein OmpA-like peptidoglycan-associated protein